MLTKAIILKVRFFLSALKAILLYFSENKKLYHHNIFSNVMKVFKNAFHRGGLILGVFATSSLYCLSHFINTLPGSANLSLTYISWDADLIVT